ncbi:hypothetical protein PVAP13_6KG225906 [Panicum virgatum]|uniref:Uncharacterized protein n=1 Tax=Panicum virgatum TaxID=38727 RepID=A0A8T0RDB1_PANVG|nr:hypothetical protein PVAP13_6KG225906 [Panicum virgatum]
MPPAVGAAPHVVVPPGIGPSRAGRRSARCILSAGPGPAMDMRRSPLQAHRPPRPQVRGTPAPASCWLRVRGGNGAAQPATRTPWRPHLQQATGGGASSRSLAPSVRSISGGRKPPRPTTSTPSKKQRQSFVAPLPPTDGSSRWRPASTKYRRRPASTSRRCSRRLPALARDQQSKLHEGPDAKHLRAGRPTISTTVRGRSKHLLNTSTRLQGHRGRLQCTQPL